MAEIEPDPQFEELLNYLRRNRGFDFTGYKRSTLMRRIAKRMQTVNIGGYAEYTDYLEVHPDEFAQLFNTILINVTGFFRDPLAWEFLAAEVIPRVVAGKKPTDPIRVWSAGCAAGQEAYSLAILFAEALGPEVFRERVKIYGTDLDAEALHQARLGSYTARELEGVKPEWVEKYFEPANDRFSFRKDLRRSVIFGRHDLMQDAPISRLDLLVCRNALMYFNAEAQARILDRFHFAVNEGGFLFLGKAEMLLTQTNVFVPVDLKRRVFQKQNGPNRNRLWSLPRPAPGEAPGPLVNHVRLRDAAFDTGAVAQFVLDASGHMAMINQPARALFGLGARDLGQPLADLELSYRPAELRGPIEQATAENRPVLLKEVEWRRGTDSDFFDIQIVPLRDNNNGPMGTSMTFANVTQHRRLQEELQRSNLELESAYEELQATNEELETTNEELQSTVEELETTNEELQSTNEELETINEELQSANEELQTMNEELRQRGDELNQVNTFLQSILASFRGGVVVVDRDLLVQVWNDRAADLWGLRTEEVQGKHFMNLDIGLPVDQLRPAVRACLAGEAPQTETQVQAVNRRGRRFTCRVTCTPLRGPGDDVRGAILVMDEQEAEHAAGGAEPTGDGAKDGRAKKEMTKDSGEGPRMPNDE